MKPESEAHGPPASRPRGPTGRAGTTIGAWRTSCGQQGVEQGQGLVQSRGLAARIGERRLADAPRARRVGSQAVDVSRQGRAVGRPDGRDQIGSTHTEGEVCPHVKISGVAYSYNKKVIDSTY